MLRVGVVVKVLDVCLTVLMVVVNVVKGVEE